MMAACAPSVSSGHLPRFAGEKMPAATAILPCEAGEGDHAKHGGGGVPFEGGTT